MTSYAVISMDVSYWILQISGIFKTSKDLVVRLNQEDPDTLCLVFSLYYYLPYIPLCSFIFFLAVYRVVLRHKTFWFLQLDHEKARKIAFTGAISFTGFFLLLIWLTTGNICDFQTIQLAALVSLGIDIKIPSSIKMMWNPMYLIDISVWFSILIHLACTLEERVGNYIFSSKERLERNLTKQQNSQEYDDENPTAQSNNEEDSKDQKMLNRKVGKCHTVLDDIQIYPIPGVVEDIPKETAIQEPAAAVHRVDANVEDITTLTYTPDICTITDVVEETIKTTTNHQFICLKANMIPRNTKMDADTKIDTLQLPKNTNSSGIISQPITKTRHVDFKNVPTVWQKTTPSGTRTTSPTVLEAEPDSVPTARNKKSNTIVLKGIGLSLLIVSSQIGSYMAFDESYSYWSFLIISNIFRISFRIALPCILILHKDYFPFFARKTKEYLNHVFGLEIQQ